MFLRTSLSPSFSLSPTRVSRVTRYLKVIRSLCHIKDDDGSGSGHGCNGDGDDDDGNPTLVELVAGGEIIIITITIIIALVVGSFTVSVLVGVI